MSGLDDVTTYYLLHRHDFGMDDAPIGACILYAISCGLSDHDLADRFEILQRTGGQSEAETKDEEPAAEELTPKSKRALAARSVSARGTSAFARAWATMAMLALPLSNRLL